MGGARGALEEGEGGRCTKIRELKAERERIKIEEAKAERIGDLAARRRAALRPAAPGRARRSSRRTRGSPRCSSSAACSRKRSTRRTSPRSWRSGRASRSPVCSRARSRSWSRWRTGSTSASSARTRRCALVERGGAPRTRRAPRSQAPDGLVPVPRADRRRQDRAGAGARRVPVRRRARDGAHRHERVPGEAHRRAA